MSGVGGTDSSNGPGGPGGPSGPSGPSEATAADSRADSASVDAAMGDVSDAEVAGAAASVTGDTDAFEAGAAEDADEAAAAEAAEAQAAELCIGTSDECDAFFENKAKEEAEQMTDEEAIERLDGRFLHDPTDLDPRTVRGLEALQRSPDISDEAKDKLQQFLDDYRNGVDRLEMDGQLGRPDAPRVIEDPRFRTF